MRAVYTDAQGFKETVTTDAGFITNPTVGSISLNDTTPTEGQTLTVNTSLVTDADGLGPFSFQWQSSANGTTWTNIAGATSASFVVPDAPGTALGAVAGQRAVGARQQHLGDVEIVAGKEFFVGRHQARLTDGGAGLKLVERAGAFIKTEHAHAGTDGAVVTVQKLPYETVPSTMRLRPCSTW